MVEKSFTSRCRTGHLGPQIGCMKTSSRSLHFPTPIPSQFVSRAPATMCPVRNLAKDFVLAVEKSMNWTSSSEAGRDSRQRKGGFQGSTAQTSTMRFLASCSRPNISDSPMPTACIGLLIPACSSSNLLSFSARAVEIRRLSLASPVVSA